MVLIVIFKKGPCNETGTCSSNMYTVDVVQSGFNTTLQQGAQQTRQISALRSGRIPTQLPNRGSLNDKQGRSTFLIACLGPLEQDLGRRTRRFENSNSPNQTKHPVQADSTKEQRTERRHVGRNDRLCTDARYNTLRRDMEITLEI